MSGLLADLRTLPLSGRQEAWGGEAESDWWPVHSKGVLCASNYKLYQDTSIIDKSTLGLVLS